MSSPHQGGSLSDFAQSGTSIPNDAGIQNTLPSVTRPDQQRHHHQFEYEGQDQPSLAMAADNPRDMPRSTRDMHASGEVTTGTGDALPAEIESKRLHYGGRDPGAKGDPRNLKHAVQNRSQFDKFAGEDPDADAANQEHEWRNRE
ncbi:hypothetical protein DTO169E5_449 [Paecilomyces variotii]|nr:hypothetical protein DTO169E5_449 [Paecilomyces variotii]